MFKCSDTRGVTFAFFPAKIIPWTSSRANTLHIWAINSPLELLRRHTPPPHSSNSGELWRRRSATVSPPQSSQLPYQLRLAPAQLTSSSFPPIHRRNPAAPAHCWCLLCSIRIGILQAHRIHRCSTSPWSITGYRENPQGSTMVKCIVNRSENLY